MSIQEEEKLNAWTIEKCFSDIKANKAQTAAINAKTRANANKLQ